MVDDISLYILLNPTNMNSSYLTGNENTKNWNKIYTFDSPYPWITTEKTLFNGTNNIPYLSNPWDSQLYTCTATDGEQFYPKLHTNDSLNIYNDFLKAVVQMDFNTIRGKESFYDLEVFQYKPSKGPNGILSMNATYNNFVFDWIFNASSVYQSSIFVSNPLFEGVDQTADIP